LICTEVFLWHIHQIINLNFFGATFATGEGNCPPGYPPASGQSRDREAPETLSATAQFAHVRSFACRSRLRNLL